MAAAALVVAIYAARPASVGVFTRVVAWKDMGRMLTVTAVDGDGKGVEANVFVIDETPGTPSGEVPILFVHGFPTSSFDWKDVWPALCHEAARRCIAFDMLGYGLSDKPAVNYTVAMHAETLRGVLRETVGAGARVDVIAHDLGDTVVQELLAAEPGCSELSPAGTCPFRAVVLLNGGILPAMHRPTLAQRILANDAIGPWAQHAVIRPVFGVALSRVFGPKTQPSRIELDEDFALAAHNGGVSRTHSHLGYMAQRRALEQRLVAALSGARVPILLINGPADPVSGRHAAQAVSDTVPGVDVRVLPDHVGHFPQREMPRVVAGVAAAWLARQAP